MTQFQDVSCTLFTKPVVSLTLRDALIRFWAKVNRRVALSTGSWSSSTCEQADTEAKQTYDQYQALSLAGRERQHSGSSSNQSNGYGAVNRRRSQPEQQLQRVLPIKAFWACKAWRPQAGLAACAHLVEAFSILCHQS